jgi:hypothetical protein
MAAICRYQSNSARKLLIYITSLKCFFSGHLPESLCLQGFGACQGNLSTKLSTEKRENSKVVMNQQLSGRTGCTLGEAAPTGPTQ